MTPPLYPDGKAESPGGPLRRPIGTRLIRYVPSSAGRSTPPGLRRRSGIC
jgi:hypothetical protein